MLPDVRTAASGLELSSSEPLKCKVVFIGVSETGGGWLSLEIAEATCWTMAGISSAVSGHVSVTEMKLSSISECSSRLPRMLHWVDRRPEVALPRVT